MKRSLLIIFAVILSFAFALTAYASYEVNTYADSVDFLTKLGILSSGDSISDKAESDSITRGEFALLAYRSFGGKVSGDGNAYFYDVTDKSDYYDAVNVLAQLGILNGNGQGRFEPDSEIKLYDALAVMLRLMGYQNPQKLSNELFVSKVCSQYDLLEKGDITENISDKKTIITLYTKLLSAEVMDIDYIGYKPEQVIDYSIHEDSLLSRYFNIFKAEGILVSNGMVNIDGDVADDTVAVVGETTLKISEIVVIPVGSEVDAYYTDSDRKVMFAIYPDDVNTYKTLGYNELSGLYDGGYEYEENGKIKKLSLDSKNTTYIYNNSLLTSSADEYLLPEYANILFTDSDGNGKYDVVDIKAYSSFLLSWINEDNGLYTIGSDDGITVYIDEEEPCIIKDAAGNRLYPKDLSAGVVVSCAVTEKTVNEDVRMYAKDIVVSEKRITGVIDSTEENNDIVDKIFIGENEYNVYPFNERIQSLLSPSGNVGTFCLDFMGNIADMDYDSSLANVAVGFVIDVGEKDTGMDGNRTIMYIFDELERVREYVFAEKVVVDGVKNPENFNYTSLIGDVILFKVDEKDCIDYIDTAATFSEDMITNSMDSLIRLADSESCEDASGMYYNSGCKAFDGTVNIDAYTMILSVPAVLEGADKDDFKIMNITDLVGGTRYRVAGYGTDPESVVSDIVVIKSVGAVKSNNDIAVVTQIGTSLNKEGIETYSLHIFDKTGKHVYPLKSESLLYAYVDAGGDLTEATAKKTVQTGDLVRFKLDENGEIEELVLTYDLSEDTVQDRVERGTKDLRYYYYYSFRTFTAIPYSINDGYLRIAKAGVDNPTINDYENISFDFIQNVFYVDKVRGKINVTKMLPSAIKTVKNSGTLESKMIVNFVGQSRVNIYIYDEEVR